MKSSKGGFRTLKKVAVLGASGFIGKPICNRLEQQGWQVARLSRVKSAGMHPVDLFDEDSISDFLKLVRPNVVISTAWETEHGEFWNKPTNDLYSLATIRFAEICFNEGVNSFIGLGTMTEYGYSPGKCNSEITPLEPLELYSQKKVEASFAIEKIARAYDSEFKWLRIFQAFGANEKKERFIPSLINTLGAEQFFSIQTPNNVLDWIHVEDIASALVFSISNGIEEYIDIGSGIGTSVRELSNMLCRALSLDSSLLKFSDQPGSPKSIYVDAESKLFQAGWRPEKSLSERLESLHLI